MVTYMYLPDNGCSLRQLVWSLLLLVSFTTKDGLLNNRREQFLSNIFAEYFCRKKNALFTERRFKVQ